jgi:uncharacterized protein YbjT (DUF2867 family)
MTRVGVIGAAGPVGRRVVRRLAERGATVVALGRDGGRLAQVASAAERRIADLADGAGLAAALADLDVVVSCAHARFVPALLAALPRGLKRLVALGSTRMFTRFPDAAAEAVRAAEAALAASGRPALMLHPTMIYGGEAENNIQRLVAWLRRVPLAPLPGGGRNLVQPVHVDDVAEAVARAALADDPGEAPLVVAGPAAMTYAEMVRAVARAIGRPVRILPLPAGLLVPLAALTPLIPFLPTIRPAEVRRLLEDKAFDVAPLRRRLGIEPMPFDAGLRRMLAEPGARAP